MVAGLACAGLMVTSGCGRKLPFPTVDVHSHTNVSSGNLSDLISAMDSANLSHMFILSEPVAANPNAESGLDTEISFYSSQASRFKFFYGGKDLNPILHGLGHVGSFSVSGLYPNGAGSDTQAASEVTWLQTVASNQATWITNFQNAANAAVATGKYICFGEFGPLHYSRKSGQPAISYPVNHAQMKWLADLAATNNMCLDIHLELTSATKAEFEELLAYNRNTKIVWDHSGWSTSGEATASETSALLAKHSNLYLSMKLRRPEDSTYRLANPFRSDGKLKQEWLTLLETYSSRIMVGMDLKYWSESGTPSSVLKLSTPFYTEFYLQLTKTSAEAIASGTAKRLFGL